jgi:glycosyltransferase involved in cell wall biosynthesis
MKIAFLYPTEAMTRVVDSGQIFKSDRGLTGSELACYMYAQGLAQRGHQVSLFWNTAEAIQIENFQIRPYQDWLVSECTAEWDSCCAWMRPEGLTFVSDKTFRLFNQQVSRFVNFPSEWESFIDILTPLSSDHANYLAKQTKLPKEKFRLCYNGVDLKTFKPSTKVSGRAIWASSHDRGLHWLLGIYEEIKARVPEFHLRVFYHLEGVEAYAKRPFVTPRSLSDVGLNELRERSLTVLDYKSRLKDLGVEFISSVSRERMASEFAEASLLPYPCDPISYTETFGVSVLEACASGAVPFLCYSDSFLELWSEHVPGVKAPFALCRREYIEKLISALLDPKKMTEYSEAAINHAKQFSWDILVPEFEECLLSKGKTGLRDVNWSA